MAIKKEKLLVQEHWYEKTPYQIALTIVIVGIVFGIFVWNYYRDPCNNSKPALLNNVRPQEIKKTCMNNKAELNNGLVVEDIIVGSGTEVKSGDTILVHYKGTLQNGEQFDSSYDRGQPFDVKIGVGQVIPGWDQGVPGMKVGGKRKLIIPPALGYGDRDLGVIPPNSTLTFEIEVVDVK